MVLIGLLPSSPSAQAYRLDAGHSRGKGCEIAVAEYEVGPWNVLWVMPVRTKIPFLAIVTHLVITQHGPEGRLFGPRFVFTLHSDPSVSLGYQVPSEVAEGLVLQAENRKEEAPEMCSDSPEHLRQPGTSQSSQSSHLRLRYLSFFLLCPWEPVRACFQFQEDDLFSLFPSEFASSENVLSSGSGRSLEGLRVDGLVLSCWS